MWKLIIAGLVAILIMCWAAFGAEPSAQTHWVDCEYLRDNGQQIETIRVSFYKKVDPQFAGKFLRSYAQMIVDTMKPTENVICFAFDANGDAIDQDKTSLVYVAKTHRLTPYAEYVKTHR